MIRIGYFADGPWSHAAFEKIQADSRFKVEFICVRNDSNDEKLKAYCQQYNIPYLKHPNVNSEEFIIQVKTYNADLFVSMSFNQIFKKEIIHMPRLKTINCHAGKLPMYRGRNILNWALINDEKEYGVTVHFVDEGIDTGDIILQKTYPITDNDTYATLLAHAHQSCADVLYEALILIAEDRIRPLKQKDIHSIGMYCGMRKSGDEILNWNQSSREIFNFIRAICKPGPQATTFLDNYEVKINSSEYLQDAPVYKGVNGQILAKEEDSYIVKTQDTCIRIKEITTQAKIKVGDRLK